MTYWYLHSLLTIDYLDFRVSKGTPYYKLNLKKAEVQKVVDYLNKTSRKEKSSALIRVRQGVLTRIKSIVPVKVEPAIPVRARPAIPMRARPEMPKGIKSETPARIKTMIPARTPMPTKINPVSIGLVALILIVAFGGFYFLGNSEGITFFAIKQPASESPIEEFPIIAAEEPAPVEEAPPIEEILIEEPIVIEPVEEVISFAPAIIDADNNVMDSTIQFENTADNITTNSSSDSSAQINITKGIYDATITLSKGPVKEIDITNLSIDENFTSFLRVDDVPEFGDFVEVYAIDPTSINFTSAEVTVMAHGGMLYKCKNWDFDGQTCIDNNWTFVMSIMPGENYTFTLTPEDPAFAETNTYTYNFFNTSDTQYIAYRQMTNATVGGTNISSSTVSLAAIGQVCWSEQWLSPNYTSQTWVNGTWIFTLHLNCAAPVTAYPYARIFKYNGSEYSVLNTTQNSTDACTGTNIVSKLTQAVSYSQVVNLSVGNRIGTQICLNVTGGNPGKTGTIIYEGTAITNVQFPNNTVIIDNAPTWANQNENATTADQNQALHLSVNWTDDYNLSYALLSTNETGTWQNKSGVYGSPLALTGGTTNWSNFTWQNTSIAAGTVVAWSVYANDSRNQWNVTNNMTFTVGVPPNVTLINPAANFYNDTATPANVLFNCSAVDNYALSNITLYLTNSTNQSFSANSTTTVTGSSNWSSWTLGLINGNYTWNCRACDSSNNCAFNSSNRTLKINYSDVTAPTWSNNQSSYPSPYNASQLTIFNITWADAGSGVSVVLIESNISGAPINYTATRISGTTANGVWNYNQTAGAGTFYWKSYANDTLGNRNASDTWVFTINKANNPVTLLLNGSAANLSVTYGQASNATASIFAGIVSLYKNGSSVSNPEIGVFGAGAYIYLANGTGNANYSDNSTGVSYKLIVSQATPTCSLTFNGTSGAVSYGSSLIATCGCTVGGTLYRNGTNVTATENGTASIIGAGTWDYVCNTTGNANYTSATNTSNFVINKAITQTRLFLNGTEGNRDYNMTNVANFTVSVNVTGATVYLNTNISGWIQQSGVTPLTNITTLATVGYYNITGSYLGDSNYSASSITYYVNVSYIDTIKPTVTALSPSNNSVDVDGDVYFNCSASDNNALSSISLYFNGSLNQTKTVTGSSSYSTFNLTGLADGAYSWYCLVNDTVNNFNVSSTYNLTVSRPVQPIYTNFTSGNSTNWSSLPDVTNVCNGTAIIDKPTTGQIRWLNCINASAQNFDINININQNFVSVNFGLNPTFNSTAEITIRNLSWSDTEDFNILIDGQICPNTTCANVTYDNSTGKLVFDVGHFTNFSTNGTSTLVIWDQNDTGMPGGDQTACASNQIKFFANYSRLQGGVPTPNTGATCTINFTDSTGNAMTYNATSLYYEYNRTFTSTGIKNYNVSCVKTTAPTRPYIEVNDSIDVKDCNAPTWSNNQSSYPSPYNASQLTIFNITWADNIAVSTILIEGNWSGSPTNYSATLISGTTSNGIWSYNQTLPAGTFYWKSYANDTSGNRNTSDTWAFTINKADNLVHLYLNGTENNVTYTYPSAINATGTSTVGTVYLYRNGTLLNNSALITSYINIVGNGTYIYLVNATGNANYSDNTTGVTYNAFVNKATSTCSLNFDKTSPQIYGTLITATCTCTNPEAIATLYRNGSDVSFSENGTAVQLGAGTYNYVCNISSSENYTSATNTSSFNITKANNPVTLLLNGSASNLIVTYGQASNATASATTGLNLYRNGSSISNPDIGVLGAGTYIYFANATGNTNYNANVTGINYNLTVNQVTSTCSLTFDKTTPQNYGTNLTAICSCTANSGTVKLYRNGSDVTGTENNSAVTLAASTWGYVCNTTGNANYTSATNTSNFVINKAITQTRLFLNGTEGNRAYDGNDWANFTVNVNVSGATVYLNTSIPGWTLQNGTTPLMNYTQLNTYGVYSINGYFLGNDNYSASSVTYYANVSDLSIPNWSANNSSYPAKYSPTTYSQFNISWSDAGGIINTVLIESNWSGSAQNYTMIPLGGNIYSYSEILPAGTFYWKSYANDTGGNWNSTPAWNFTIDKADNPVTLLLNGSAANLSVTYGQASNATASIFAGIVSLYKNGSSVSNPEIGVFGAGAYIYLANGTGNANYSDNSTGVSYKLIVSQATPTCSLTFNGTSGAVSYGSSLIATCGCTVGGTLYRNGTNVTATENGTASIIGAGTWDYVCNTTGNANYTSASNSSSFVINKANNPVTLLLNESASNLTVTYGQASNATASSTGGTVNLYRNGTLITSGSSPQSEVAVFGAGTYIYFANATGNANYSDNSTGVNYNLTVNQVTSTCSLTFDKTTPQNYGTNLTAICSCTANSGTVKLYRNGSDVTGTENNSAVTLAASTWGYVCNTTGNANYTSATNTSNFVINKSSRTCTLSTDKSWTRTYDGTSSSTSCTVSAGSSDGSMTFTRNSSSKTSPDLIGTAGTYDYVCQWTGGTNYSDCAQQTNTLIINKAATQTRLFLNGTEGNKNYTILDVANFTVSVNVTGATVYLNTTIPSWINQSSITPLVNITTLNDLGIFSITGLFVGNENYTDSNATYTINVADNITPTVHIISPANNVLTNLSSQTFSCNVTDNYQIANLTLYVWNSTGALIYTNTTSLSGTTNSTSYIFNVPDGTFNWSCLGKDTSTNSAWASEGNYTIAVDSAVPSIYYNSNTDQNNTWYNRNWVLVNVTASDLHKDTIKLYWNGAPENFQNNAGDLYWSNKSSLIDGTYNFYAWINDTAQNVNQTSTRYVYVDATFPQIVFASPTNVSGLSVNRTWIAANVSIVESNLKNFTYYLYNTSLIDSTTFTTYPNMVNWTGLIDGVYYYNATVYDNAGNLNYTETRNITIDVSAHTVIINSPLNKTYNTTSIWFNVTAGANTTSCVYSLDNQANSTMTNDTVKHWSNYSTVSEGAHNVTAFCTFSLSGDNSSDVRYFTIDTTKPSIYYNPTTTTGILSQNWIFVNVTCSDINRDKVIFNWNGTNETFDSNSGDVFWENKTILGDGTYTFYAWCNDTAGNNNSTTQNSVLLDATPPTITFVNPTLASGTIRNINWVFINITSNEPLDTARIYWNGTNYPMTGSGTNWYYNATALAEGLYVYSVYANDTIGNSNFSETRNVTIDTVNPSIYYNPSATPLGVFKQNWIFVNVTCSDINRDKVIFNWNGTNETFDSNSGDVFWENKTILGDGTYTFYAWCNDTATNSNGTSTRTVILDTVKPLIQFVNPTTVAGVQSETYIVANVTAYDINLANITIELRNTTHLINSQTGNTSNLFANVTSLNDGTYYLRAVAFDYANNSNSTETRVITIDTTSPVIIVLSPYNQTYNASTIWFNATSNKNIDAWIVNYNGTNITISINSTLNLVDGTYQLYVYGNDTIGNWGMNNSVYFTVDTINPSIYYNSNTDQNNTWYNRNWILVNVTASDLHKDTIKLYWNGAPENFQNNAGDLYWSNKSSLIDGTYNFYAWINDTAQNVNQTSTRYVYVDTTLPKISFGAPTSASGVYVNRNWIIANVSIVESNLKNFTYYLYNTGLINSTTFTTYPNMVNWTGLIDGVYYYNATVYDNAGNLNYTETRNITIDTVPPSVSILNPTNIIYGNATILVNISSDGNNIWYNWNGINATYTGPVNVTFAEDTNTIYAYANDSAGNLNSTSITFTVDTTKPSIQFVSPTETSGATFNRNYILVNVSASDLHFANTTIYLYNATDLVNNTTSLSTNFFVNFTGLPDGIYYFNATDYDTLGNFNSTTTRNVTIDTVQPLVTLISPANATTLTNNPVTLSYNVTDVTSNIANCVLYIDNASVAIDTTITKNITQIFELTFTNGHYNWKINCADVAGNANVSEEWIFDVAVTITPPPSGGGTGGLPPNITINVTPPTNVTNVTPTNVTILPGQLVIPTLEPEEFVYILKNPTLVTVTNITIVVAHEAVNETPQPINYPNRLGWDIEELTGWSIFSDVINPRLMKWEIDYLGSVNNLGPNESAKLPLKLIAPLTKSDSQNLSLSIFSNGKKLYTDTIIVNISKPKAAIFGDYHADTELSDIYMIVNDKNIANSNSITMEFSLTDGKKTLIFDYFGPYTMDNDGKLIIAQRYHFANSIGGKVYDMHIKVYDNHNLIAEADGSIDLTPKPVKKPLFGLF